MSRVTVHHGDSREVLKTLSDASVDSVVCDPPYALLSIHKRFSNSQRTEATENSAAGPYMRTGRGFMGQKWDTGETAFDPAFWVEVLRVLKPGGHLIAFSGTRTYHRLACAIEDAGFEMRDMIAWLYGSGFPKSHDVSKGIDKVERGAMVRAKLLHFAEQRGANGAWLEERGVASAASFKDWTVGGHVPSDANWLIVKAALSVTPEEEAAFERAVIGSASNGIASGTGRHAGSEDAYGFRGIYDLTGSATEAARQWEGWGTALKPALEPIVLARKPLAGTVAANVLAHGTGALNIDGSRIGAGAGGQREGEASAARRYTDEGVTNFAPTPGPRGGDAKGRWPANVIHDGSEEVIGAFPPSESKGGSTKKNSSIGYSGKGAGAETANYGAESGSAARFFYSSKADAADRCGSKHPTVKPIDLMAYLCRLVTRPGGLVLDPFAGSGSTGIACLREGFDCILIEREAQYVADIHARLAHVEGADTPLFANDSAASSGEVAA